jgi:hypothetical protein
MVDTLQAQLNGFHLNVYLIDNSTAFASEKMIFKYVTTGLHKTCQEQSDYDHTYPVPSSALCPTQLRCDTALSKCKESCPPFK